MQKEDVLLNPYETAAGAVIVSIVGGVIVWLQSVWKKAVKADVDAIIAAARTDAATAVATAKAEAAASIAAFRQEMKERNDTTDRRISQWEQRSGSFVTREAMAELERKMDRMESRIEASINKITDRLDKLLETREWH